MHNNLTPNEQKKLLLGIKHKAFSHYEHCYIKTANQSGLPFFHIHVILWIFIASYFGKLIGVLCILFFKQVIFQPNELIFAEKHKRFNYFILWWKFYIQNSQHKMEKVIQQVCYFTVKHTGNSYSIKCFQFNYIVFSTHIYI